MTKASRPKRKASAKRPAPHKPEQPPRQLLRRIRPGHVVLAGCMMISATLWLGLISFFFPSNLTFSFSKPACVLNPLPLPRLTSQQSSDTFQATSEPILSIGGYPLFSHKTCIDAADAPAPDREEALHLAPFGNPLLKKRIKVTVEDLPAVTADFTPEDTIGTAGSLRFRLDKTDQVFGYRILANERSAPCEVAGTTLTCPLQSLQLSQGLTYPVALGRYFDDELDSRLYEGAIKTLDPIVIQTASIKEKATIYDTPTSLTLTASKKIASLDGAGLFKADGNEQVADVTYAVTGTDIKVTFAEPLERETDYEFRIGQLQAEDGSQLKAPYVLRFYTSGGPKVASSSIGTSRVSPHASISITFDVGLKPGQDFDKFVRLEIGGKPVPAAVSATGKVITINPSGALPACTGFTVRVSAGLISTYDISDGEAWQLNSRTLCQVAFSIGRSVQGRSITAYRFGNGSSRIMFIGGVHGNETSSINTLRAFINYLEDHSGEIPAHRSIIIIPVANPDGYAMGRRTNANNVDLNRNFPANDWRSAVQMPGGQNLPEGGGKAPLDQPESAAIASFINQNRPRFVLTYHAVAGVVISNDAGDSVSLGRTYAGQSGLRFTTAAGTDNEFGYATTGELEDWLVDKKGIPGILVEQTSMYYNQFPSHRSAIMNVVRLP